ncbi:GNAT family N-acetyltransferase [Candidatus Venteria ishoeyi]|uniref:GNAT family N-acetyltransferase n=1 Tax=Candidatus Venteria ishoeyi TaxID=1899563 RepID=UPI0025A4E5AC|nr:GNAT family N-acetyltransferase [Candidatus Venteria ishoeyi]MDM8546670.1 GNAT family N-acetyltransferase [Candidatus Venteria ishoeyi]
MEIFKEIPFGSKQYEQELILRNKSLREPLGLSLSEVDLNGEEQQYHFGLFADNKILGCVVFKIINNSTVKLRQMAIQTILQGKGFGSKLINKAEQQIYKLGYENIEMSARFTAIQFYQKLGYSALGKPFIEQGIEHIKMYKNTANKSL